VGVYHLVSGPLLPRATIPLPDGMQNHPDALLLHPSQSELTLHVGGRQYPSMDAPMVHYHTMNYTLFSV